MNTKFDELVAKLTEIFQIDKPELDFGVYKILHARAGEIKDFLSNKLKARVQATLQTHGKEAVQNAYDTAKAAVINGLGANAIKADGSLDPLYEVLPLGQKYMEAKAALEAAAGTLQNESLVYSHLLTFFGRYYEDGDFISKRRYKEGVYAIPYSGEEVKLHWANADQYYTKSGENFTNYDFTLEGGAKVHFVLVSAQTAKDNIKDNDAVRRFVLFDPNQVEQLEDDEDVERPPLPAAPVEEKDGELVIYFRYMKVPKPKKSGKNADKENKETSTQKGFNQAAIAAIQSVLQTNAVMGLKYAKLLETVSKDDKRTYLQKHLADYTEKNTRDYFIHKDLRGFLERELDYYVKSEMMQLDRIDEAETIRDLEANLHVIQAFRSIARVLIGFMAQLEDFQKKLFLKKKFVTSCEYCITMDRLSEALRKEALANPRQKAEWAKWNIGGDPRATNMMAVDARMVDTKCFVQPDGSNPFKDKLLKEIEGLDDQCDGVLIHADNFHALRLLLPRYRTSAKCIYIDPPYNTGGDGFLYRDAYKHSSWMSMIADRLELGRSFCTRDGAIIASIDETEQTNLRKVFDAVWGQQNYIADFVWAAGRKNDSRYVSISHEYMLCFARDKETLDASKVEWRQKKKGLDSIYAQYEKLKKKYKTDYATMTTELKAWFRSLPDSEPAKAHKHYSVIDERGIYFPDNISAQSGKTREPYDVEHPITHKPCKMPGRGWPAYETMQELLKNGLVDFGDDEKTVPCLKSYLKDREYAAPYSVFYQDGRAATKRLREIMGNADFGFPKDETVIADTISSWTGKDDLFLDYFGGSGTTAHAVIALNREDKGHRKYILVEMGDHFDTVLKPRIEKVVYSPKWEKGEPTVTGEGVSHCFKYLTLESYEDTLNNLELKRTGQQSQGLFQFQDDAYLLKYMLDVETRGSVISTDDFRKPFDYELKIAYESSGASKRQKIDLVETFNYLIGLKVDRYVREVAQGYVCCDGTLPSGEHALVFWRDCEKVDAKALNKLVAKFGGKAGGFDVLYVNGDHAVQNGSVGGRGETVQPNGSELKVRQIESEFLDRMFAGEEA